jgi:hypothetical protein
MIRIQQQQRPIFLSFYASKPCINRLYSDKPRNRKWELPPSFATSAPPANRQPVSPLRPVTDSPSINQTRESGELESWLARKIALKNKYPEGWRPSRKLSPEAIEGIRILHRQVDTCILQTDPGAETAIHICATC